MDLSPHPTFDLWLKSLFTAMIVGGTGSGKTHALFGVIYNATTIATDTPVGNIAMEFAKKLTRILQLQRLSFIFIKE